MLKPANEKRCPVCGAALEDAARQGEFQYNGALNYAGDDVIAAAERLIKTYLEIVAKG